MFFKFILFIFICFTSPLWADYLKNKEVLVKDSLNLSLSKSVSSNAEFWIQEASSQSLNRDAQKLKGCRWTSTIIQCPSVQIPYGVSHFLITLGSDILDTALILKSSQNLTSWISPIGDISVQQNLRSLEFNWTETEVNSRWYLEIFETLPTPGMKQKPLWSRELVGNRHRLDTMTLAPSLLKNKNYWLRVSPSIFNLVDTSLSVIQNFKVLDSVSPSTLKWISPNSPLNLSQNLGNVFFAWNSQKEALQYQVWAQDQNQKIIDLGTIPDTNLILNPFIKLGAGSWRIKVRALDPYGYTLSLDSLLIQVGTQNLKVNILGQNRGSHLSVHAHSLDSYPEEYQNLNVNIADSSYTTTMTLLPGTWEFKSEGEGWSSLPIRIKLTQDTTINLNELEWEGWIQGRFVDAQGKGLQKQFFMQKPNRNEVLTTQSDVQGYFKKYLKTGLWNYWSEVNTTPQTLLIQPQMASDLGTITVDSSFYSFKYFVKDSLGNGLEGIQIKGVCALQKCGHFVDLGRGYYQFGAPSALQQILFEKTGFWTFIRKIANNDPVKAFIPQFEEYILRKNEGGILNGQVILRTYLDAATYRDEPLKNTQIQIISPSYLDTTVMTTDTLGLWSFIPAYNDQYIMHLKYFDIDYTEGIAKNQTVVIPRPALLTGSVVLGPNSIHTDLKDIGLHGSLYDSLTFKYIKPLHIYQSVNSGKWIYEVEDLKVGSYLVQIDSKRLFGSAYAHIFYNNKLEKYLKTTGPSIVLDSLEMQVVMNMIDSNQKITGHILLNNPVEVKVKSGDTVKASPGIWTFNTSPTDLSFLGHFQSSLNNTPQLGVLDVFLTHPIRSLNSVIDYKVNLAQKIQYTSRIIPDSMYLIVENSLQAPIRVSGVQKNDTLEFTLDPKIWSNGISGAYYVKIFKNKSCWSDFTNKTPLSYKKTKVIKNLWVNLANQNKMMLLDTLDLIIKNDRDSSAPFLYLNEQYLKVISTNRVPYFPDSNSQLWLYKLKSVGLTGAASLKVIASGDTLLKNIEIVKASPQILMINLDLNQNKIKNNEWFPLQMWGLDTLRNQKVIVRPQYTWNDSGFIKTQNSLIKFDSNYLGVWRLKSKWRGVENIQNISVSALWKGQNQHFYLDSNVRLILSDSTLFNKNNLEFWLLNNADWKNNPLKGKTTQALTGPWSLKLNSNYPIYKRPEIQIVKTKTPSALFDQKVEPWLFNNEQKIWREADTLQNIYIKPLGQASLNTPRTSLQLAKKTALIDTAAIIPKGMRTLSDTTFWKSPIYPEFITFVGEQSASLRGGLQILPNPFSPQVIARHDGLDHVGTRLRYYLPNSLTSYWVQIEIRNMIGEKVRLLEPGKIVFGDFYDWFWDGLSDQNKQMRNGRYLILLEIRDALTHQKISSLTKEVVVFE